MTVNKKNRLFRFFFHLYITQKCVVKKYETALIITTNAVRRRRGGDARRADRRPDRGSCRL